MKRHQSEPLAGELLDEDWLIALEELCRMSHTSPEYVIELVDYGLLRPRGRMQTEWRFSGPAVVQVKRVLRLQHDLEVNLPGAVLIVEILDELEQLRRKLEQLE